MRIESSATSLSWIPSEAVTGPMRASFATGISHYDTPPAGTLGDLEQLREQDAFRFANRLHAWVDFAGTRPVGYGQDGGGLMGATTVRLGRLDATFAGVTMPDLQADPVVGDGWVRFTQTCGGRTALPLPRTIRLSSASSETAYSGLSYWLSTTIPVPGRRLRTSLAPSMPSFWKVGGIRISVTSTCG